MTSPDLPAELRRLADEIDHEAAKYRSDEADYRAGIRWAASRIRRYASQFSETRPDPAP